MDNTDLNTWLFRTLTKLDYTITDIQAFGHTGFSPFDWALLRARSRRLAPSACDPRTPMLMQAGHDYGASTFDPEIHAVRKPPRMGCAEQAHDLPKYQWVLGEAFEYFIDFADKLSAKPYALTLIPILSLRNISDGLVCEPYRPRQDVPPGVGLSNCALTSDHGRAVRRSCS